MSVLDFIGWLCFAVFAGAMVEAYRRELRTARKRGRR